MNLILIIDFLSPIPLRFPWCLLFLLLPPYVLSTILNKVIINIQFCIVVSAHQKLDSLTRKYSILRTEGSSNDWKYLNIGSRNYEVLFIVVEKTWEHAQHDFTISRFHGSTLLNTVFERWIRDWEHGTDTDPYSHHRGNPKNGASPFSQLHWTRNPRGYLLLLLVGAEER